MLPNLVWSSVLLILALERKKIVYNKLEKKNSDNRGQKVNPTRSSSGQYCWPWWLVEHAKLHVFLPSPPEKEKIFFREGGQANVVLHRSYGKFKKWESYVGGNGYMPGWLNRSKSSLFLQKRELAYLKRFWSETTMLSNSWIRNSSTSSCCRYHLCNTRKKNMIITITFINSYTQKYYVIILVAL